MGDKSLASNSQISVLRFYTNGISNTLTVRAHAGVARSTFLLSSNDLHGMSQAIPIAHAAKAGKQESVKIAKDIGGIKAKQTLKWQTEHEGTQ